VDDGYAIIELFNTPEAEIMGISTVMGNTTAWDAYIRVRYLVEHFGPEGLGVYLGTSEPLNLNEGFSETLNLVRPLPSYPHCLRETPAYIALRDALADLGSEEKMTIVAIGALTNIAVLLLLNPELHHKIEDIIVVAGRSDKDQEFKPATDSSVIFRDLNFDADPEAFRIILQTEVPLVLAGFEVAHHLWINEDDLTRLSEGDSGAKFLSQESQDWIKIWQLWGSTQGFNPYDAIAAAYAFRSDLFEYEDVPADIIVQKDDTQKGKENAEYCFKSYLIANEQALSRRTVRYCYNIKTELKDYLMARFLNQ